VADFLLKWGIERARQNVDLAPEGSRVVLHTSANTTCREVSDLLSRNGLDLVRHGYRMIIDFDRPPASPILPEGIVIRPIAFGKEERDAVYAGYEAFQDHWGFIEEPFEQFYKRWQSDYQSYPYYDPSMFFIAVDGEEIAGISLCLQRHQEYPDLGWISSLGVRRPWRKRGLGLALLQHSFTEFYQRGITKAGLGVDAENITGAVRLYEKAGMRVMRRDSTYELELRAGKDLMRQDQ
jgi:ribosomal protein S18 acetylase RimI-like enzyme